MAQRLRSILALASIAATMAQGAPVDVSVHEGTAVMQFESTKPEVERCLSGLDSRLGFFDGYSIRVGVNRSGQAEVFAWDRKHDVGPLIDMSEWLSVENTVPDYVQQSIQDNDEPIRQAEMIKLNDLKHRGFLIVLKVEWVCHETDQLDCPHTSDFLAKFSLCPR